MEAAESDVEVRRMRPDDAPALSACFTRVYGPHYADPVVYDPDALAERLVSGRHRSVVAVIDGTVVGHMAMMYRTSPPALTCDSGMTIVDPAMRGNRLSERLGAAITTEMQAQGLVAFHHYPVTVNTVTQRLGLASGGVCTGFMFGATSVEATRQAAREPTTGRSAAMVLYQPLGPSAPHRTVHLPARLADVIGPMAEPGRLQRTVVTAAPRPAVSASAVTTSVERDRHRAAVATVGADVADVVGHPDAAVAHVDLPLGDPATPWAAERLHADGWFFSAWLPEWHPAGDVLRLQRLGPAASDQEPPRLVTGHEVWQVIESDRPA